MPASVTRAFKSATELELWLSKHHQSARELWVRIFKKDTGKKTVTYPECVEAAIAWGWIDGQRRAHDEVSFVQRLTPRRPRSNWSKRNCELVERLIAEGRMQPAGLVHVEAARADGRWERAYAGSAEMVIPADFLEVLEESSAALRHYKSLNRSNLFAIYHRLHTAKSVETRERRMRAILAKLERGEKIA